VNAPDDDSRPGTAVARSPGTTRSAIFRAAGFMGFWLILTGADSDDLVVGLLAAGAATWVSLRLMQAGHWHLNPVRFAGLTLHFLYQSISAGFDVAMRALKPDLPLQPGLVVYRTRLPEGVKRNTFCSIMSLLPGTLPCGAVEAGLSIHCLDVTEPVIAQLSVEEARYMQTPKAEAP
jgi:multicomponent Na+:H+ antiporter subunit E